MCEIAEALFGHIRERFPSLLLNGGPHNPPEGPAYCNYIMTMDYIPNSDIQVRIGRLELRGTVLSIYTDMDFTNYQFTDKKCGELDLIAPDSIDRLDDWIERQVTNHRFASL